jgi:antitoxin HicB
MPRYSVVLVPDAGNYMVLVPALPGCVTFGGTQSEALAMAKDAIRLELETRLAEGEELPQDEGEPILATVEVEPAAPSRSSSGSAGRRLPA